MKIKNGFTLAEVLITLAIIGVVASLTLPSLMTNVQEQQTVTALKKGANTLIEAATLNAATNGFDYNNVSTGEGGSGFGQKTQIYDSNGNVVKSVYGILGSNANVDLKRSSNTQVVFRDGTSITSSSGGCTPDSNLKATGITAGTTVIFDSNGPKNPNKLSTCSGNCADRKNRKVYDQLKICLGGANVWGADDIAKWALTGQSSSTSGGSGSGS